MIWLPGGEKNSGNTFSLFDTIPERDKQTDRRMNNITRAMLVFVLTLWL